MSADSGPINTKTIGQILDLFSSQRFVPISRLIWMRLENCGTKENMMKSSRTYHAKRNKAILIWRSFIEAWLKMKAIGIVRNSNGTSGTQVLLWDLMNGIRLPKIKVKNIMNGTAIQLKICTGWGWGVDFSSSGAELTPGNEYIAEKASNIRLELERTNLSRKDGRFWPIFGMKQTFKSN